MRRPSPIRGKMLARWLPVIVFASVSALCAASSAAARPRDPQEEVTRTFDQTVTLGSNPSVRLDHRLGSIQIHTSPGRNVRVIANIHVSASSRSEAESFADHVKINMHLAGSLSIHTEYPDSGRGLDSGHRNISFSVDYNIEMPEDVPLTIKNSFGDVSITGLKSTSDVNNSHGQIVFRDGRGNQRLENSFGGIELSNNAGDAIVVNTNGFVHVTHVEGSLDLRNRFGEVTANNVGHRTTIANSNGNVAVVEANGPVTITNGFGSVRAENIQGELSVRNGNGEVNAHEINGAADLSTSFAAIHFSNISQRLTCTGTNSSVSGSKVGAGATIRTTFGTVDLKDIGGPVEIDDSNGKILLRSVGGAAQLRTSFGSIDAAVIGGSAVVSDSNGSVTLAKVAGNAEVRNSFGAVALTGIRGPARVVSGNGNVTLDDIGGEVVRESRIRARSRRTYQWLSHRRKFQRRRRSLGCSGRGECAHIFFIRYSEQYRGRHRSGQSKWLRGSLGGPGESGRMQQYFDSYFVLADSRLSSARSQFPRQRAHFVWPRPNGFSNFGQRLSGK